MAKRTGINRYIMECKCCFWQSDRRFTASELIDTLWNVNDIEEETEEDYEERINRYIMECK